jgi:hypothetical protein
MWRNGWRALLMLVALTGLAACGTLGAPAPAPGKSDSIAVSLKTVPTIRSVTVSPGKARFGNCTGGRPSRNTASTSKALGFPNGSCAVTGPAPAGSFPVTITNTGIASSIEVSGTNAVPKDGGTDWSLCNLGSHPAVACTDASGKEPGVNQYLLQNTTVDGRMNAGGLTDTPTCDHEFDSTSGCLAMQGSAQNEGIDLTGPYSSDDISTSWTVTITWTPIPK